MSARPYKTVCVSMYVEELVALDAKVDAMKAAGYTRMSRSRMLVMSALALEDAALTGRLGAPKVKADKPKRTKKAEAPRPDPYYPYRCGKCGVYGHNRRTCRGEEVESR